uniref:ribonuclease H n=1 Tax=Corvus moneduloides TaxID=1196302 RepID=A0A8C3ETQ1_CORMO
MPSRYVGAEPISISGVTGGSQQLTVLEAEVSLTGNEWQKHPIVTGPEAPCILGIDYLRNGYFKDPKGHRWAFGIAAVETEDIRQLSTLPGLSDDPSAVGLLRVAEQQVPIATATVHRRQYRTDRDSVVPIHEMIRKLESQGVVSKAHSPFNSPIWPVRKSSGEWRLTVDYRGLNEVTPPLGAAVPDMLELQYELESKAAKWYATIDIANAFFSIPLAAECRPQFAFTWKGVQYTWNRLPQGWKHSPTICHGLIQTALEKGEAPEHLQYIDDIIVWGNTAKEVFEKGEKIIQILLEAGFAIKRSKVKGPAQEIQFLGVKWQDGRRQIPTEVINKITAMSPPTSKKETQAFLGAIGFWRMHIPEYSQIVSPLYLVTRKKNDFHWGPEQQQAFAQIKQEIAHAVALGPVRTGPEVKNVLYSAAGNNGLSWSLWQKVPGETRGRPLGFWSRSYRGSEANYTPTEKEILAAYEGVQAASEVIGTEAQLLLAPRLPVLGWMFKGKVPSTHHATDTTWSKWIALITQRARIGNPNRPGILEIITNWPEGETFGLSSEEEEEQVTRAEEAPPYNELPETERRYALFTDGSCRIVGANRKWKAAVWSPTRRVAQATEGQGGSSQVAELKAVQLALDIAEREKWPRLYLYTDSWMVANALWGWLDRWRKANWQRRGKPIWAAEIWQDIAARVEKLTVKVRHVDAHVPKSRANEEHRNNEQVDRAAKVKVSQVDLDWQHKGELFLARWAHDASGHQGRDATYRWARDRGVDLSMDSISQVIHSCETCAAIKQAKRVKPLWYGGRWSKYRYGEAWQVDYITLPQTRQGKHYVLTMVEATTGWLETYPVPHATARNTILGLEKQVLWRHGTPDRIESDNGTHFKNSLINTWAREHGIEWIYHIPYHAPAAGKVERCNGLLKTTLKALGGGTFKNWEVNLAKATWIVNTRGSINRAGPAESEPLHTVDGDRVPAVHLRGILGKTVWINPTSGKDKPIRGIVFAQGPGCTWWVMQKDGETRCVPQGDLILGENGV